MTAPSPSAASSQAGLTRLAILALVAVLCLTALALGAWSPAQAPGSQRTAPPAAGPSGPADPPQATLERAAAAASRVASFNLLGAGHTKPGGDRPGWASGRKRMTWAVRLIAEHNLQVVGFQEMQTEQYDRWRELQPKSEWGIYPGKKLTSAAMANSIAWRKDVWRKVEVRSVPIRTSAAT
ncbi:MAG: hypothetical protein R2731_11455 [Nocardioides sp.]